MGFMLAMSPCFGCRRTFTYNPGLVPSITDPKTGTREPVCAACVERVNPLRVAGGLAPIVPLPGAYEPAEAC